MRLSVPVCHVLYVVASMCLFFLRSLQGNYNTRISAKNYVYIFFSKISLNPTHLCCRGPTSGHGLSVTQSVSVSVYLLCHFVYFCFRLFQFWFLAFFVFSYIIRVVNVSVSAFESSSVAYYVYYSDPRRSLPLFLFLMDRMSE